MKAAPPEPPFDCKICPRLTEFREQNSQIHQDWFNGPVPSFGPENARLLIVGLAPGLKGANRTGRPFTGDYAGELLYPTLIDFDFARGQYWARIDDGLKLQDCMITNAVRCVPPQNKPVGAEINACRSYLSSRINHLKNLRIILALGRVAHDSTVASFGGKKSSHPFKHAGAHKLTENITLFDSYHCSRYNLNTGRLTKEMFQDVFLRIRECL